MIRTQPFGASRAPGNRARVTRFVQLAMEFLCGIDLQVYVGGCIRFESAATCKSAFYATNGFNALLRLRRAPYKGRPRPKWSTF